MILLLDLPHQLINASHRLFLLNPLWKAVTKQQRLISLQLQDRQHLPEGQVDVVTIGPAAGQVGPFSAFRIPLYGGFGLFDHVVVGALPLLLLPSLHLFYLLRFYYRLFEDDNQ